jgi:PAS domain S-box-containing protein
LPATPTENVLLEGSIEELYDQAPCGYVSTDPDGLILKINQRLLSWTGHTRAELVGTAHFSDLLTVGGKIYYNTHIALLLRMHGAANEIALELASKGGERRPVLISAVQKRSASGAPLMNRFTIFDASERRRYENELLQERRRAEKASADLEVTNAELRRLNDDLQQFAYSASHDLKEPLRTANIYASLLERKAAARLEEQERAYLKFIVSGARRAQALLDDLLEYLQATHATSEPVQPIAADHALTRVLTPLASEIKEAGANVEYSSLPMVRVREVHLTQLFQNLITNALKYRGKDPPIIHIGGQSGSDSWAKLWVADNGIGIDPQHAERVFGLFKRLHSAGEYPGTGLGLAICRKVVDSYGGRIWVESAGIGHGSTFYFLLPSAT